MRNAVKCALAGGLLAAGALGPLCGAALAAPSPTAPRALVLAAAPERPEDGRTLTLVCASDAPGAPSGSALVCTRVDGAGDPAAPTHGGPAVGPVIVAVADDGRPGHARAGDRTGLPEDSSGRGEVPAS
ncbi:hypothetical protein [Streptomyces macrosporus]|uniref:Uncharacterized protein n=1 Tax=Streptomyces macrosporus TaxID=44032 RepID=A0ABN3JQD0_9ACTN